MFVCGDLYMFFCGLQKLDVRKRGKSKRKGDLVRREIG